MSINSINHNSWKDKRIQAMNRIIEKNPYNGEYYIDEYDRVTKSKAKTKKEYKGEINAKTILRK
jgi:hypothetical protein